MIDFLFLKSVHNRSRLKMYKSYHTPTYCNFWLKFKIEIGESSFHLASTQHTSKILLMLIHKCSSSCSRLLQPWSLQTIYMSLLVSPRYLLRYCIEKKITLASSNSWHLWGNSSPKKISKTQSNVQPPKYILDCCTITSKTKINIFLNFYFTLGLLFRDPIHLKFFQKTLILAFEANILLSSVNWLFFCILAQCGCYQR